MSMEDNGGGLVVGGVLGLPQQDWEMVSSGDEEWRMIGNRRIREDERENEV